MELSKLSDEFFKKFVNITPDDIVKIGDMGMTVCQNMLTDQKEEYKNKLESGKEKCRKTVQSLNESMERKKKFLVSLFSCQKCENRYNTTDRIPFVLSCGHYVCAKCLFSGGIPFFDKKDDENVKLVKQYVSEFVAYEQLEKRQKEVADQLNIEITELESDIKKLDKDKKASRVRQLSEKGRAAKEQGFFDGFPNFSDAFESAKLLVIESEEEKKIKDQIKDKKIQIENISDEILPSINLEKKQVIDKLRTITIMHKCPIDDLIVGAMHNIALRIGELQQDFLFSFAQRRKGKDKEKKTSRKLKKSAKRKSRTKSYKSSTKTRKSLQRLRKSITKRKSPRKKSIKRRK